MSFVKSFDLEQKLSRLVNVPIPFVPSSAFNHFQWESTMSQPNSDSTYHSVELAASLDPGYFARE